MTETQVKQFDIIITGAGPAGCTAALSLQDSGLKVALIDKEIFPRDKVCGDAIPGSAIKVLKEISPELASNFASYEKQYVTRRTSISYNNKKLSVYWNTLAYTCARLDFDNWLMLQVKKTNIAVLEGIKITAVEQNDDAITLTANSGNKYKTALLIGTDGAHSIAAKKLAQRTIDRKHHISAVRAYYSGVEDISSEHTEVFVDKHFLPGYLWIFPVADGKVNVGFGMISHDVAKNKVDIKRSLVNFINTQPALQKRFANARLESNIQGFDLPLGSRRVNMSGKRYMLAGDAASLIDPISGDGIGNAMVSGRLAAKHAMRCFETNRFDAAYMQEYDTAVWNKLGKELELHYRVQRLAKRMPRLTNFAFSLAHYEPVRRFLQSKL